MEAQLQGTLTKAHTLAQIHPVRAYELDDQQAYEKALRECDVALQRAPDYADAHNLRGVSLRKPARRKLSILSTQK